MEIANYMNKEKVLIVSLTDSNVLRVDFSWSTHAALCQG